MQEALNKRGFLALGAIWGPALASAVSEVMTPARQLMNAILAKPPNSQSWGL